MKKVSQKYLSHDAFTMIELIFVIVVLGILSAVALPKFGGIRDQADVSKARTDVAAIRASIMTERQSQLIKGNNTTPYIGKLSSGTAYLFTGDTSTTPNRLLMTYGIVPGSSATVSGKWTQNTPTAAGLENYNFRADTLDVVFTYYANSNTTGHANGSFICDRGGATPTETQKVCKRIVD